MTKINAVRFLDARVNGGSRLITNKVIPFNGNTTLLYGGNGIGKTSIINLIQSLFIHAGKRKEFLNRSFTSYFHHKPTYILVEFLLDDNAGKLLVGMMGQLTSSKEKDALDQPIELKLYSFVHEYPVDSNKDIYTVPFITSQDNKDVTMNWTEAKNTLEKYKKNYAPNFHYFDMNDSNKQTQYFDKLHQYNIEYTHWEDTIYQLNNNKAEKGISGFFAEDKSQQAFIDNRIIPLIVKKLDANKQNQTDVFVDLLQGLILQKRKNKESLAKEQSYTNALRILKELIDKLVIIQERFEAPLQLTAKKATYIRNEAPKHMKELNTLIENYTKEIKDNESYIKEYEMERDSLLYYKAEDAYLDVAEEYAIAMNHTRDIEQSLEDKEVAEKIFNYLTLEKELNKIKVEIVVVEAMIEKAKSPDDEIQRKIYNLGGKLHTLYQKERDRLEKAINDNNLLIEETKGAKVEIEGKLKNTESELGKDNQTLGGYKSQINIFEGTEKNFNRGFGVELVRNPFTYRYELGELEKVASDLSAKNERLQADKHNNEDAQDSNEINLKDNETKHAENITKLIKAQNDIEHLGERKKTFDSNLEKRLGILPAIDFSDDLKFDNEAIFDAFKQKINENRIKKEAEQKELTDLESKYNKLMAGEMVYISSEMVERFTDLDISVEQGFAWLQNAEMDDDDKAKLLAHFPFLPNVLIVDRVKDIEILKTQALSSFTDTLIPVVLRKNLEQIRVESHSSDLISVSNDLHFLYAFDQLLLTDDGLKKAKAANKSAQDDCQKRIDQYQEQETKYESDLDIAYDTKVYEVDYKDTVEKLRASTEEQASLKAIIDDLEKQHKTLLAEKETLQNEAKSLDDSLDKNDAKLRQFKEFEQKYESYQTIQSQYDILEKKIKNAEGLIEQLSDKDKKLTKTLYDVKTKKGRLGEDLEGIISSKLPKYSHYEAIPDTDQDLVKLETYFDELNSQRTDNLKQDEDKLTKLETNKVDIESKMAALINDKNPVVSEKDIQGKTLSDFDLDFKSTIKDEKVRLNKERLDCHKLEGKLEAKFEAKSDERDKQQKLFLQRYPNEPMVDRHTVSQYTLEKYTTDIENLENDNQKIEAKKFKTSQLSDVIKTNLPRLDDVTPVNDYSDVQFTIAYETFSQEISDLVTTYNSGKDKLEKEREIVIRFYEEQTTGETNKSLNKRYSIIKDDLKQNNRLLVQQIDGIKGKRKAIDDLNKKAVSDNKQFKDEQDRIFNLLFERVGDIIGELGEFGKKTSFNKYNKRLFRIDLKNGYSWPEKEQDFRNNLVRYLNDQIDKIANDTESNIEKQIKLAIDPTLLFKKTVGEDNVRVRILKIEENNAKYNDFKEFKSQSGGESTLSSFVIIVSLMYYAYDLKNLSDGVAAGKQRKAPSMLLLLDNPFGQLTSPHLLLPMFQLADKLDVQLISLTDIRSDVIANMHSEIVAMSVYPIHMNSNIHEIIDAEVEKKPNDQIEKLEKIGMARFSLEQSSLDLFSV